MVKLYASEMAGRVADRAVQVFGGRGYMRENVAERFYRELRVERIWEGASEVQRADHRRPAGQAGACGTGVTGAGHGAPGACTAAHGSSLERLNIALLTTYAVRRKLIDRTLSSSRR